MRALRSQLAATPQSTLIDAASIADVGCAACVTFMHSDAGPTAVNYDLWGARLTTRQ